MENKSNCFSKLELGFYSGNECDDNDSDGVVKDESYFASLVDKLIDDALSLRVNGLDIRLDGVLKYSNDIRSKVFSHRYLRELCLVRCQVHCPGKVLCSDLLYLGLHDVSIRESAFKNILAGCPKIEKLVLFHGVNALKSINASELQNLKTLMVGSALKSTLGICGQFLNLRRLLLNYIVVYDSFFKNLSSNFPELEDLALEYLRCYSTDIKISSHSIKHLSLKLSVLSNLSYFDVPNIEKFEFYGRHIPSLSFTASPNEWKSEITFSNFGREDDCKVIDLSKLRELLIKLGRSEITLCLNVRSVRSVDPGINIESLRLPAVEKLTLRFCTEYNLLMECLLICRPKLVSISYRSDRKAIPILYKKLVEQMNHNGFINSAQDSSSLCINDDLKEVIVELFEESFNQWLPINDLSQDLERLNHGPEQLRFILKWGSLLPKYTIIEFVL